eukprot:PhF_6_TR22739/c0_g1_i1/m.32415/K06974/amzA, AMZ2, AMZ1; archaemetzincin
MSEKNMKAMEDDRQAKKATKLGTAPAYTVYYDQYFKCLDPLYPPLKRSKPGDWLKEHPEPGQTFNQFLRKCVKATPHATFNTLMMVPIGDSTDFLDPRVLRYLEAFFQLHTDVLPPVQVNSKVSGPMKTRENDYGTQLYTDDCFNLLRKVKSGDRTRTRTCVATVGVTMYDLTPQESWNFVFGIASMEECSGMFSLVRYSDPDPNVFMRRTCKVLTHEVGHIFGLKHCIHHLCLMNGSNNLEELDRNGMLLCPVCAKKLMDSFGWDMRHRLRSIVEVMKEFGTAFEQDINFLESVDLVKLDEHEALMGGPPSKDIVGTRYKM